MENKFKHADSCGINFEKSFKAMEAEGAVMLFSRSVEKLGLQYTSFIADRDSATYREILRARPYGSSVTIVKKECVGHIQKGWVMRYEIWC